MWVIIFWLMFFLFQIWKKTFCQNSDTFCYSFIKNDIMVVDLLCIYKKTIIESLFKIDTLNFTCIFLQIW